MKLNTPIAILVTTLGITALIGCADAPTDEPQGGTAAAMVKDGKGDVAGKTSAAPRAGMDQGDDDDDFDPNTEACFNECAAKNSKCAAALKACSSTSSQGSEDAAFACVKAKDASCPAALDKCDADAAQMQGCPNAAKNGGSSQNQGQGEDEDMDEEDDFDMGDDDDDGYGDDGGGYGPDGSGGYAGPDDFSSMYAVAKKKK